MTRKSARIQYVLLALVASVGLIHAVLAVQASYRDLTLRTVQADLPFDNGAGSRALALTPEQAQAAGVPPGFVLATITSIDKYPAPIALRPGDAVYTVEGVPYTGPIVLRRALAHHVAHQTLDVTFWQAGTPLGSAPIAAKIPLLPVHQVRAPVWVWIVQGFFTLLPIFCLVTGWYVVFARPRSPFSWLILGILGYISALLMHPGLSASRLLPLSLFWTSFGQTAMALCFMLFGIYFPERAPVDRRLPWIKWIVIIPTLALFPLDVLSEVASVYSFRLHAPFNPYIMEVNNFENILATLCIFYAFYCLQSKLHQLSLPPDARRRIQVLNAGSTVGLTPLLLLLLISMYHHGYLGTGAPEWLTLTVLALLSVFPLTLAYVVVVQRAMDVRIILRQGTKYFFARQSIFILGLLLAAWMSFELSLFFSSREHRVVDMVRILGIIAAFFVFRTIGAKRMQRSIDEKFFREAYSSEQLLSELSDQARTFTETAPLLETITQRLSTTLHIDRIAVFLRTGEIFQLQFATGLPLAVGCLPALPAASTTITHLARGNSAPANVYRDDPSSWLIDATDAERTALADLSTELLVPLPGRNRLVGVLALGPKSSEEPYSKTDRQLLQSVASQTGLALENAELLESLTAELAKRASLNREIEIAREVQERLFPQTYPQLPGIGLAGYCRPAQFVGGDYYDFFLIPQPGEGPASRLAIAIGDISGKGISAALLMASLRASLRSVATIQSGYGERNLATLMEHVNRLVYEASTSNRYATFFYAELDPATRVLSYVNAGHNCPVLLRPGATEAIQLQPTGTVIGLLPMAAYDQASIQLQPGDTLLAFTDGISEAMTAEDEEWGEDRMTATARNLLAEPGCNRTAAQLLACILQAADTFTAGAPQHDDMTLLLCTIA